MNIKIHNCQNKGPSITQNVTVREIFKDSIKIMELSRYVEKKKKRL